MRVSCLFPCLFLACFSAHDAPETDDAGIPLPLCEDRDNDGYGEGPDCRGPDCDDDDPERVRGCPECEGQGSLCYEGELSTRDVGRCMAGRIVCPEGSGAVCIGQVLPASETCNALDDDCDGEIDEGVRSSCGTCDPTCHLACAGIRCDVAFDPGDNAAITAEGAFVAADPDGDITQHSLWVASASNGQLYRIDTRQLEIAAHYNVGVTDDVWMAVDTWGTLFTNWYGLKRIDAGGCTDTNGDGVVRTSTGADDPLHPDEDDCFRWSHGRGRPLAVSANGALWVARRELDHVQLDPETAEEVRESAQLFTTPTAMVAAADGLWFSEPQRLCFLGNGVAEADCTDVPADFDLDELDIGPDGSLFSLSPFACHDPASREHDVLLEGSDVADFGFDLRGRLWVQTRDVAGLSRELLRFDADLSTYEEITLDTVPRHFTTDLDGHIWTFPTEENVVAVAYDVETHDRVATLQAACFSGQCMRDAAPMRGDPSGVRLRRSAPDVYERAEASAVFEATCPPGAHRTWSSLRWSVADTGPVLLEARTAPDRERLAIAPWRFAIRTPPTSGDLPLRTDVDPAAAFLEVRARLRGATAQLDRVEVQWRCDP